jgi:NDP-sugar pyrophosphorylase family protein
VTIGAGAVVDRAVLLDGAGVGSGAHVRESIVGANASIEDDAKLTDHSIVGTGARVVRGTTLAAGRVPVAAPAR